MQNKYTKKFKKWCARKTEIHKRDVDIEKIMFQEKEIWWCATGVNVGFEQDGKNTNFERPILIYKKFNKNIFWGIPLTTQNVDTTLPFYLELSDIDIKSTLILSQLRLYDSRRLLRHIRTLNGKIFKTVKQSMKHLQRL